MKILLISDFGSKGGASLQLLDLVKELVNQGIKVVVLVKKNNSLSEQLISFGAIVVDGFYSPFYINSDTGMLRFLLKVPIRILQYIYTSTISFKEICKKYNFDDIDIVHTYNDRTDIGAKIAQKFNKKHIWHIHEFGELDYGCKSIKRNYIEYINNSSVAIICVSKAVQDYWIKKGIDYNKCIYMYNGLKENMYIDNMIRDWSILKICIVGTICDTKGQDFIINGIRALNENNRQKVFLDIIGDGNIEYVNYIKKQIKKYDLNRQVRLLGYSDNIAQMLGEYNIGIMASRNEAFGRVTIEYMLSGLLVLASNSGANNELIENGVTGFLFDRKNPKYLTNLLTDILEKKYNCNQIAQNGYDMALDRFLIKNYAKKLKNFYEELQDKE